MSVKRKVTVPLGSSGSAISNKGPAWRAPLSRGPDEGNDRNEASCFGLVLGEVWPCRRVLGPQSVTFLALQRCRYGFVPFPSDFDRDLRTSKEIPEPVWVLQGSAFRGVNNQPVAVARVNRRRRASAPVVWPMVVNRSRSRPSQWPPTLPSLFRNSWMTASCSSVLKKRIRGELTRGADWILGHVVR